MGLFSSDESETDVSDGRVEELVNKAKSDTVTEERLTKTDTSGIVSRGFNMADDDPLIEYLENDEQPQFIFFSTQAVPPLKIPEADAELSTGMSSRSAVCITDRRFIVVVSRGVGIPDPTDAEGVDVEVEFDREPSSNDDVCIEIPFESVLDFEAIPADGGVKIDGHKINLRVNKTEIIGKVGLVFDEDYEDFEGTDEVDVVISNAFDKSDIKEVGDYLRSQIGKTEAVSDEEKKESSKSEDEGLGPLFSSDSDDDSEEVEELDNREELRNKVAESKENLITVEVLATFYHHNRDYIVDTSYQLRLEDSRMHFSRIAGGDDEHEFEYSKIAKIEEFKGYNDVSGVVLILSDDTQIRIGCSELFTEKSTLPDAVREKIEAKADLSETETESEYILVHLADICPSELEEYSSTGELRVEGWKSGSSEVNADFDASSESQGKSRGVELGMFSRSKTSTKSSIEGDLDGEISDNTYTSDVDTFIIFKENLVLESEIKLNLHYSEIDNIFEQSSGVIIEVGSTTFRIEDLPNDRPISEAVAFVKEQMETFAEEEPIADDGEESVDSADKLRELKELHEDGILTDEEFQSKKEELLDDF